MRWIWRQSLKSPVIWSFTLEIVQGLTPNNAKTWFCGTPAWSRSIARAVSRSVKRDRTPTDPCSRAHTGGASPGDTRGPKQEQNKLFCVGREDLANFACFYYNRVLWSAYLLAKLTSDFMFLFMVKSDKDMCNWDINWLLRNNTLSHWVSTNQDEVYNWQVMRNWYIQPQLLRNNYIKSQFNCGYFVYASFLFWVNSTVFEPYDPSSSS